MERMIGVVIAVRLNQGFAFVRGTEDRLPRFICAKDLEPVAAFDTLHEGQKVTFEPAGVLNTAPNARHNGLRGLKVRVG